MKKMTVRRWLALLLALAMVLPLSPLARAAEGDDGDNDSEQTALTINPSIPGITPDGAVILDGPAQGSNSLRATATLTPDTQGSSVRMDWTSSNPDIVSVEATDNGRTCAITGKATGEAEITISAADNAAPPYTFTVVVSGIVLLPGDIFQTEGADIVVEIPENGSVTLMPWDNGAGDFRYYGYAESAYPAAGEGAYKVSAHSDKTNVVSIPNSSNVKSGLTIIGVKEGTDRVTLTVTGGSHTWTEYFSVKVTANPAQTIRPAGSYSLTAPLRFSTLESLIAQQCTEMISGSDNTLASITGLSVDTKQGTLYLNYKSAADTGSGVGSGLVYTVSSAARGPYIKDITFVPNPNYTGGTAEINFTGTSASGRTFKGKILVTLAPATADISYTASIESPAHFDGSDFSDVCRLQTGVPLSYVVFTLPPESQGILYEGYVSDTNYSAKVSATAQYNQTDLNKLTFVPTPGYTGLMAIGYAGYSVSGLRYTGEVRITVTQSLDESIFYNDGGSGSVSFSEADFVDYCANITGARLSYVQFTPPAASQGTLYYYPRTSSRGTEVTAADTFQAYRSTSEIDRLTFAATAGFHGTVRIPFSGEDRNGVPFTGTVEINIQSGSNSNITYTCTPGGSVKLSSNDFNDMSLRLTGQRLHYITFQSLPDYTNGAFYHNRTSAGGMGDSVSREARYYNSASPYIMNLSFWASSSFYGNIEVPFTGCAVSGDTFSGMLIITSSSTVGGSNIISYNSVGRATVTFLSEDFDRISRSATNSGLNYVRFTPPNTSMGMMYFDYNPTAAPTTISSTDSLYLSGEASISKVSFLPSYSYSGTVTIPFSGWAISGAQFQGTVQINVQPEAVNTAVRYASRGEPVTFSSYDFRNAGGGQPVAIRIDSLPSADTGRLYYQYTCPTRYSWPVAAGTEYQLNGNPAVSDLTFMPKAGYAGTAEIPYTGINADGSTFTGSILVSVSRIMSSAYFNDMEGCNNEVLAAVDFLFTQGVVNGVAPNLYDPEKPIKRGDFCLMLYRAFQFELNGSVSLFQDVPDDKYYSQAIRVLRSREIVNGTGYDRFEPESFISRQDAALMIQRTLRAAGLNASDGSPDVLARYSDGYAASAYAQGALACIVQQGLQPGYWQFLQPKSNLTRADMAVLLHKAITQ